MTHSTLNNYKRHPYIALGAIGFSYDLELTDHLFFGLVKRKRKVVVEVPLGDGDKYESHWDELIATQGKVKL